MSASATRRGSSVRGWKEKEASRCRWEDFCRVPDSSGSGRHILKNDTSRSDAGSVADSDASKHDRVRAKFHPVADHRHSAAAVAFSKCHAVPQHAPAADFYTLMHHESGPVLELCVRPDLALVVELHTHEPVHHEHVAEQDRSSDHPSRLTADPLACTQPSHHESALRITGVCRPVLKNLGNHLRSAEVRVRFFIPEHHLPDKQRREDWLAGRIPPLLPGGKSASVQAWIFQTWAALRDCADVELVTALPVEGLIVTLANCLPRDFRASPRQFVVDVAADFEPHPGAQVDVVQNAAHPRRLPGSIFMPHWPQPDLVPRDPARGDRFERAAFFGDPANLAPELRASDFARSLHEACGLEFQTRPAERWHDYSDVDVAIAIRDFSRARHLGKPATKLYNAWLAGVPLIGGNDSAFSAEALPGTDYLRAIDPESVLRALRSLAGDPALRRTLVAAGQKKAASRSRDAVLERWRTLCSEILPARAERYWSRARSVRACLAAGRRAVLFADRLLKS